MLQGDVEIVNDFFTCCDCSSKLSVMRWIKIKKAQHFTAAIFPFFYQHGKAIFNFEVFAVVAGVLGDEV